MILIDTFDSEVEATFLTDILKKNGIAYTQQSDASCGIYINEADESKLNEIIKGLD
jgi:thiamine phosphate synthase YjbQ (UPF0047 family)